MKAAIYHRVSTLDQNPDAARGELAAAAKARGFAVVHTEEETGSGAKTDRPGLLRVMALARKGAVDAILVWKLDRFGRSALDLLKNIEELGRCGVRFIAVTQGLDIGKNGDPMSQLILTVMAGVAEFERELIRERTRLGLDRARKLGRRLGRSPLDDAQLQRIRPLWAQGWGAYRIAKETGLKESTVRTYCRRWEAEAVREKRPAKGES